MNQKDCCSILQQLICDYRARVHYARLIQLYIFFTGMKQKIGDYIFFRDSAYIRNVFRDFIAAPKKWQWSLDRRRVGEIMPILVGPSTGRVVVEAVYGRSECLLLRFRDLQNKKLLTICVDYFSSVCNLQCFLWITILFVFIIPMIVLLKMLKWTVEIVKT